MDDRSEGTYCELLATGVVAVVDAVPCDTNTQHSKQTALNILNIARWISLKNICEPREYLTNYCHYSH